MHLEISKNVLMDIAASTVDRIGGLEIAAAPIKASEVLRPTSGGWQQAGSRRPRALRVSREGNNVSVELGLNIEYGKSLVSVSQKVQQAVTENIELMTGLKVRAVNITVQGLTLPPAPSKAGA
ncbi:Asp23/Gls24 family envelope stress response protein [Deinococcus ruber]|uniref:Alkaline-shock protein n=1 Tax=Deinococcus ruber TaxID=1848197 RepID=A0A918EZ04_9DEIO|nr:Asp23/Gls24 family envelope stress response protein [Deinococcus ruber]GGQ92413.1 alkaline-shock protein [Deinococcus ruber]